MMWEHRNLTLRIVRMLLSCILRWITALWCGEHRLPAILRAVQVVVQVSVASAVARVALPSVVAVAASVVVQPVVGLSAA